MTSFPPREGAALLSACRRATGEVLSPTCPGRENGAAGVISGRNKTARAVRAYLAALALKQSAPKGRRNVAQARLELAARELLKREVRGR